MSHMQSLLHRLLGRQWVETQISIARRRDVHITAPDETWECICGDPSCDLPWSDGGKVIVRTKDTEDAL